MRVLPERAKAFLGKKINIVLRDNTVMFGSLESITNTELVLKNMRLKTVHFPLKDIAEVYFDTLV